MGLLKNGHLFAKTRSVAMRCCQVSKILEIARCELKQVSVVMLWRGLVLEDGSGGVWGKLQSVTYVPGFWSAKGLNSTVLTSIL